MFSIIIIIIRGCLLWALCWHTLITELNYYYHHHHHHNSVHSRPVTPFKISINIIRAKRLRPGDASHEMRHHLALG
jgi:hypothetical protein